MNPELRKKIGQYRADKLKQDLPEYGDGGKKFAAGLAGFAKNIPMLGQVIDPLVANTDAVKDNPVAYASGDLVGSTAKTIGMGVVNPMSLASNVPQTIGKGLNVGSAVATEKGNLDTAQGLNTASTALTGLGAQAGQLTSMFGNIGEGGNIPIQMKEGGSITNLPNNMASFRYRNGGDLINFKGPKHEDGGIPIDNNMKVNPFNPSAEVEGNETADPKQNYIFSDTLKPMNTKRTFAEISKSIDNKYKNEDPITAKSKERELERLSQANEEARLAKESKNPLKMKNGGNLPKYNPGGPFGSLNVPPPTFPQQKPLSALTGETTTNTDNTEGDPYKVGNMLQFGAAAGAGLANIGMGLMPAQKFNAINLQDTGMQHIKDARLDTNPIAMSRNLGAAQINQGSMSNASRIANLQNLYKGAGTQFGQLAQQENLMNLQQGNLRAQTAFNTSQYNAGAAERAQALNNAAKERKQNILATGIGQTIGSVGMYGDLMNQGTTNQMQIGALAQKNWKYNPKTKKYEYVA